MGKKLLIVAGVGAVIVIAGLAWFYISTGSGESSRDPNVATIATTTTDPAATQATEGDNGDRTAATEAAAANQVTYTIDTTRSAAQFELNELLDGNPKHVVGVTTEIGGQALIDFDNPANSQVGVIEINVRTLRTDSDFRDRAIRGPILGATQEANEFAVFTPTSIDGLPDAVAVGDTVEFTVTGDFLLSGVTNEVAFAVTVTIVSESEIQVTGTSSVLRSDYGLTIPEVSQVANVDDEVILVFDFMAVSG